MQDPVRTERVVTWQKEDPAGFELVEVSMSPTAMTAVGVAIGSEPMPYRLDFELETIDGFVTSGLTVRMVAHDGRRSLTLQRDGAGRWTQRTGDDDGDAPAPTGGALDTLDGALDVDLGLSPLFNSMPVLRTGMLDGGGPHDFLMAWVSVPDLGVHASRQRYTFVDRIEPDRRVIRFEALDGDPFVADIVFDGDGLVVDYPGLARRIG